MMRVVVVGAGYAGVLCALRIARNTRAHVTLINGSEHFVERIRLHEQAAGHTPPALALRPLLHGTGVQLQIGWVSDVDLERRTLKVDGAASSWDQLVLATGSQFADAQVEGAREHAFTLEARSLPWLEGALPAIAERAGQVAIVGGGLTGIEAASELAETYPKLRVVLVTRGELAPECTAAAREHIRKVLRTLGVELRERTNVRAVHADHLQLAQGTIPFAACLWTVGFRASPLGRDAGLPVNAIGQVLVGDDLRARQDVHIAGDLAYVAGMPMGCKSALPSALCVADNVVRLLNDKATRPFRYHHAGYCISLGRKEAVVQVGKRYLRGWLGARIKEWVCASTLLLLKAEAKLSRVLSYRFRATQALAEDNAHG